MIIESRLPTAITLHASDINLESQTWSQMVSLFERVNSDTSKGPRIDTMILERNAPADMPLQFRTGKQSAFYITGATIKLRGVFWANGDCLSFQMGSEVGICSVGRWGSCPSGLFEHLFARNAELGLQMPPDVIKMVAARVAYEGREKAISDSLQRLLRLDYATPQAFARHFSLEFKRPPDKPIQAQRIRYHLRKNIGPRMAKGLNKSIAWLSLNDVENENSDWRVPNKIIEDVYLDLKRNLRAEKSI